MAIDLYDGPYYRIIKKLRREELFPSNLDVFILSAKYGIIPETHQISTYDQKMSEARAKELNEDNLQTLNTILSKNYSSLLVNLGKVYMKSIAGYEQFVPKDTKIILAQGEIGERMSFMKNWILSLDKRSG